MSDNSDSSLARTLGQAQNADKWENVNYERALLVNRLLSWLVAIVESPAMRSLGGRVSTLIGGGWLPGKADMVTIAALTNKSEEAIKQVVQGRSRYKVGGTAYYPIAELAVPYELPVEVARAKRKKETSPANNTKTN